MTMPADWRRWPDRRLKMLQRVLPEDSDDYDEIAWELDARDISRRDARIAQILGNNPHEGPS